MRNQQVRQLLDDLRLQHPGINDIVTHVRALVLALAPDATEEVKYGGLLYSLDAPFCGIYAYARHVSIEFSRGCDLVDTHQQLAGQGKLRRHIKLGTVEEITSCHVADYISQAYNNARKV